MAKFRRGDCVDKKEIDDRGVHHWIKGLKVKSSPHPKYYTLWNPKGKYVERALEHHLRRCLR